MLAAAMLRRCHAAAATLFSRRYFFRRCRFRLMLAHFAMPPMPLRADMPLDRARASATYHTPGRRRHSGLLMLMPLMLLLLMPLPLCHMAPR